MIKPLTPINSMDNPMPIMLEHGHTEWATVLWFYIYAMYKDKGDPLVNRV